MGTTAGISLGHAVATTGPLPAAVVTAMAAHLARALADLHAAGLVHGDLGPGNVLLGPTRAHLVGGAAPAGDAPADVFALGAVLVWAATGRGPFDGGTAGPDLGALTEPARELAAQCMNREPAERPTAAELVAQLDALLGPAGPEWRPPAVAATSQAPPRRFSRRTLLVGIGVGVAAIAGTGLVTAGRFGARVRWTYPTSGGPIAGLAAGTGDTVYAVDTGTVHAIDAGTGRPRWVRQMGMAFAVQATLDGTVVVQRSDVQGLDSATGATVWKAEWTNLLATGDGVALCHSSGRDREATITAFDSATGDVRWATPVGDVIVRSAPAVMAGGRLHVSVGSPVSSLRTYDVGTGALLWDRSVPPVDSLAVDGRTVCCNVPGSLFTVLALDAVTGDEGWHRTSEDRSSTFGPVTAHDGTLYLTIGDTLAAWDTATGTPRWATPLPASYDTMDTAPVVQGDAVYVGGVDFRGPGDMQGCVVRYSAGSGERLWSVEPDPNPGTRAALAIAGGRLVVGVPGPPTTSGAVMGVW